MVIYTGADCNNLTELYCDETTSAMPTRILTGRTPGETIYIRIFGDQAKSGTFGICASDPTAQIVGYLPELLFEAQFGSVGGIVFCHEEFRCSLFDEAVRPCYDYHINTNYTVMYPVSQV